jgi:hypothetical protein
MSVAAVNPEEVARKGLDWYERKIKAEVEPEHVGKYLVINVETGEYELGDDYMETSNRAIARFPNDLRYAMRIGHDSMGFIGMA